MSGAPRVNKTREQVSDALGDGWVTAAELAQRIGMESFGVEACLRGMVQRREVAFKRSPGPGMPATYRRRAAA